MSEEELTWDRRNTNQTEEVYQITHPDIYQNMAHPQSEYFISEQNLEENDQTPLPQYQSSTRKSMRQTLQNMNKQKPKGLLEEDTNPHQFVSKINANKFFEEHKMAEQVSDFYEYNFYDDIYSSPKKEPISHSYNPKRNRFNPKQNLNAEIVQNDYQQIYNNIQKKAQNKFIQKNKPQNPPAKKLNLFNQQQEVIQSVPQPKKIINPNRKISVFDNEVKSKYKPNPELKKIQKLNSRYHIPQYEEEQFKKAPDELEREYQSKKNKLNKYQEELRQQENDPRNISKRQEQLQELKINIQKLKQENQNNKGEERIFDEDISKVRRDMIQIEMEISSLPYMNPFEADQKQKVINQIEQLQKKIRKSKQSKSDYQDLEDIRKRSKENLQQEFQEIQLNIQNYDEDLLRWMNHFAQKFQFIEIQQ